MSAHLYRSPLRPLDIGYVSRTASVAIDWEHTTIGQWEPKTTIYAFAERLSDELVASFQLKSEGYRS